jgi:UDP-glucose 4-epimerase
MNASDCAFDPVRAVEFNAGITARLLHAAIKRGVKRFIYLSTAHVYGGVLSGNISETTCAVSLHPYATSHRAGEDVVLGARQRGEIEGVAMRLSNAYGAPAHRDVNCWMLLVNDLCRQALTSQRMVLRSTGMQRRDFIALTDACRAIMALLKLPERELGDGLFNAGGEWSPTILEMAHRIAERVFSVTGRKPEIRRQLGGIGKSTEALNYQIQKLIDIGFDLSSNDIVDREIDELIRFCIENMM